MSSRFPIQLFSLATTPLLILASALPAFGQVQQCGTRFSQSEGVQAWVQQQAGAYQLPNGVVAPSAASRGTARIVMLSFHVVRRSDGSGGIAPAQLAQTLIDANRDFAAVGIEFCLSPSIDYIDDDDLFSIDSFAELDLVRSTNVVPGMINVYFTDRVDVGWGNICGYASFTFSNVQGIVMNNTCTGTAQYPSIFTHELGHYFDLFHTHEPFFGIECPDGSNCSVAGDLLCDTPADPQLSYATVPNSCNYSGSELGPCQTPGLAYSPDTHNFMAYGRPTCNDSFTVEQRTKALATLLNLRFDLVQPFCSAGVFQSCFAVQPNSTGQTSIISVSGSGVAADNNLTLLTTHLPPSVFGYYLNGRSLSTGVTPPGSQGVLCLSGALGRYNRASEIGFTGANGEISLALNLTQTPSASGMASIIGGETWVFQLWHRDMLAGVSTSNFSPAISVGFL